MAKRWKLGRRGVPTARAVVLPGVADFYGPQRRSDLQRFRASAALLARLEFTTGALEAFLADGARLGLDEGTAAKVRATVELNRRLIAATRAEWSYAKPGVFGSDDELVKVVEEINVAEARS